MGQVLRFNPLRYINSISDTQYASMDDVPREELVKLIGVGFFTQSLSDGDVNFHYRVDGTTV